MTDDRRASTLLAWIQSLEVTAQDDVLDILDQLINRILLRAQRSGHNERVKTLKVYDKAVLDLVKVCELLINPSIDNEEIRQRIFSEVSKTQLYESVQYAKSVARDNDGYFERLDRNYSTVRQFLPKLLAELDFETTEAGRPVIAALDFLRSIEGSRNVKLLDAPRSIVKGAWRSLAISQDGTINRKYYTFCVLEQLRCHLRRRDIYVTPSDRWGDPRADLLSEMEWSSKRAKACSTLALDVDAGQVLNRLEHYLNESYIRAATIISTDDTVRVEHIEGKDQVICSPLDSLEEPESLVQLKSQVEALLPEADLSQVLLEISATTDFTQEFTHISESRSRVKDLDVSICAVLLAEACNIGFDPLVRSNDQALTRSRLHWVKQNFIRAETISAANTLLVDAQHKIEITQYWGGGEVASADGLRFIVPVNSINSGANPKYFGREKGVTWYNYTSDQYSGFHGIVIPGTLRDSLFILDGLLEQDTSLRPKELMTDTAGYSDVVFALFWLLGYQFSPRLADVGDARFWRMDREAHYGCLDNIARYSINQQLIRDNWDDILRVAGSLKLGTVKASDIMRTLVGKRTTLCKALAELGRIPKTLHLLSYISDEAHRRRILTQLNRGESRNGLARTVCYGKRGELRQQYREGQENQLGVLGLVVNAIVLWNTMYMDRATQHLKSQNERISNEDITRLSPLSHKNINMLGRFAFELDEAIRSGRLEVVSKIACI